MLGCLIEYSKTEVPKNGTFPMPGQIKRGVIIDKRDGVFSTSYLVADKNGNTEVVQMTEVKKIITPTPIQQGHDKIGN